VNGEMGWEELGKVRVHRDCGDHLDVEFYLGSASKRQAQSGLLCISVGDYFEYDPYGVTPKLVSAISERALELDVISQGWHVTSMPDDKAAHLGEKEHYDFQLEASISLGETFPGLPSRPLRLEVKSLWGTDTTKARLIHSVGGRWTTSSIRFEDQDIIAVSRFLQSGNASDFAYAASVSTSTHATLGLPASEGHPAHASQNPDCHTFNGTPWFDNLNDLVRNMIRYGLFD